MELCNETFDAPRTRTLAMLQAAQLLGLYRAEVARILGCLCGDVGELFDAQRILAPEKTEWNHALFLIQLYKRLSLKFDGNEVRMSHWLRRPEGEELLSPLSRIVDDLQIEQVLIELI